MSIGQRYVLEGGDVHTVTYSLRNFSADDAKVFKMAEKEWEKQAVLFVRVDEDKYNPDVVVFKSTAADIKAKYAHKNAKIHRSGLSLTDRTTRPIQVHLHKDNWDSLPVAKGTDFKTIAAYRQALVQHELAHALGYMHVQCPCVGCPMDIRQQPSRNLGGCLPTTDVILYKDAKNSKVNF
jgi:hypothetical protein